MDCRFLIIQLLELTVSVHEQAKVLDAKMENNNDGQLESLQLLFEKRQQAIDALAKVMEQPDFRWADGDQELIAELKTYEDLLQPLINGLHNSFLAQMNRVSQTKQASKKYIGAYQTASTEGSFIDQRK